MFVSSLIHERTLKTVLFQKKTVLRENHVNREIKALRAHNLAIQISEHEYTISCNATFYLS